MFIGNYYISKDTFSFICKVMFIKRLSLPTDYIIWSKRVAEALTSIIEEAKGTGLELWISGSLSKKATTELKNQGWKIHTKANSQLLPSLK